MKASAEKIRRDLLRDQAEKSFQKRTERLPTASKKDVERLVHELGVHQIELELQNEELRQAQEGLETSHRRYAELYEFAPAGYFTFDRDGTILESNQTGADLLGVDKRYGLNKRFSAFIADAASRETFEALLSRVFVNDAGQGIDVRLKRGNRVFDARIQLIPASEMSRCRAMVIDISERKQLEDALRESEEHYRLLFDRSPLPKWVFDLETFAFLEVNQAAIEHYGYSRDEFQQITLANIFVPEEFENLSRRVKDCCADGQKFEGRVETKHLKKNHDVIDVEMGYAEITYKGRRAALSVGVDITDRIRTEQVLRESEEVLRTILNSVYDGILLHSRDGRIFDLNERVVSMYGVAREELLTLSIADISGPSNPLDRLPAVWDKVIAGEPQLFEWKARRPHDGAVFDVEVFLSRVRMQGRYSILATVRDISDRKRTEQERERLITELRRSNDELQQFAYVASHDLQEPLRTVSSYVELLAMKYRGKLDQAADKYISFAVEGASRMSELINDLLAFSRVSTERNPMLPMNSGESLETALRNLRKAIRESGADITRNDMPEVTGDPSQLAQLFQNLIANAIKFRKKDVKPQIRITAERKGAEWTFGVHDNGIGIEPRFYQRIFTIFQRLHTKEEYPGTGVGLALCRKIVERHGGRIWVESEPGEGSSFYFTLPGQRPTKNSRYQIPNYK